MDTTSKRAGRLLLVAGGAVAGIALGWALFVSFPGERSILGVLSTIATGLVVVRVATRVADSLLGPYDTVEVHV